LALQEALKRKQTWFGCVLVHGMHRTAMKSCSKVVINKIKLIKT